LRLVDAFGDEERVDELFDVQVRLADIAATCRSGACAVDAQLENYS